MYDKEEIGGGQSAQHSSQQYPVFVGDEEEGRRLAARMELGTKNVLVMCQYRRPSENEFADQWQPIVQLKDVRSIQVNGRNRTTGIQKII